MKKLKLSYFGSYHPDYSRNKILIKGLEKNNCQVLQCHDQSSGIGHYYKLFKRFIVHHRKSDLIIVGAVCVYDVPLAWFLAKLFRKKVIYDAFISLYDTYTSDREALRKNSFAAKKVFIWEFIACHLADCLIFDTELHASYFRVTFKIKKEKTKVIYIGADDGFFKPKTNDTRIKRSISKMSIKPFIAEFHGSFQPLQGVDYIIKAAAFLKNERGILLNLIGDGQTKKKILKTAIKLKLKKINFLPTLSLLEIRDAIAESDAVLGIFGKSDKAMRVIPNKVFEGLAMQKPIITMDSPGARELLIDGENSLLISNRNPRELVNAIKYLKNNPQKADKIARSGYKLFLDRLKPEILGRELRTIIDNLVVNSG